MPTFAPTVAPSATPTLQPTAPPSVIPTTPPTNAPTSGYSYQISTPLSALTQYTKGIFVDTVGTLYLTIEVNECKILQFNSNYVLTTSYGNATCATSGTTASAATFNAPGCLYVDTAGNIFVVEYNSHVVTKISTNLAVSTYAGIVGTVSSIAGAANGDGGPATSATISHTLQSICGDSSGNLYLADKANYKVRKVDNSGIISTYAGNGGVGYSTTTGPATSITLYFPNGVWMDSTGVLWILESISLKKVDITGILSTISAVGSSLALSYGLSGDTEGNIFIADMTRYVVKKYSSSYNTIVTVAGINEAGGSVSPGPATSTGIGYNVYICVYSNVVYIANYYASQLNLLTLSDPTLAPSPLPTVIPTVAPSAPTVVPTIAPTVPPTASPTTTPTAPTIEPSVAPSSSSHPTSTSGTYLLTTHTTTAGANMRGIWGDSLGYLYTADFLSCTVTKYNAYSITEHVTLGSSARAVAPLPLRRDSSTPSVFGETVLVTCS